MKDKNNFEKRMKGTPQFVSRFEDFKGLEIGDLAVILLEEGGEEIFGYYEGAKVREANQELFLQYPKDSDSPSPEGRLTRVVKYSLPKKGKIHLDDFQRGYIETKFLD